MQPRTRESWLVILAVAVCGQSVSAQAPLGTAFSYQGQLKKSGLPVTNTADFQFTLWDSLAGGTQMGGTVAVNGQNVVNGLFTVTLDFGAGVFPGDARWLEILVRSPAGSGSFTTLAPRQELTPAPYAIHAATAAGGWGSGTVGRVPVFAGNQTLADSLLHSSAHGVGVKGAPYWGGPFLGGPDLQVNAGSSRASFWIGDSMTTIGQTVGTLSFIGEGTGSMFGKIGYGWIGAEILGTDPTIGALHFDVAHPVIIPDPGPAMRIVWDSDAFRYRVGIGTKYNPPQAELEVFGTILATGFQMPTGAAQGLVLTSDASGVGSWQAVVASADWTLTGNAGTAPGTNFVGTTDNQALEFRVNNQRALRLEPNNFGPNVIGGIGANSVSIGKHAATIGGGGEWDLPNQVTDDGGTVGGGLGNSAAYEATVSGGAGNAAGDMGTVGGGVVNHATGIAATVGGGESNAASGAGATIGGGGGHTASGEISTIAGGDTNQAIAARVSVGGGANNIASSDHATVAGGLLNTASGYASTIGGGELNFAQGDGSTVGGGVQNHSMAIYTTVAGGTLNEATVEYATVGGGYQNKALGGSATVAGGYQNTASNNCAFIGAGQFNQATGAGGMIPGGFANVVGGNDCFAAGYKAHADHNGAFVWADFTDAVFSSERANQFRVRANGGARFDDGARWVNIYDDGTNLITTSTGAHLTIGGVWANSCSRNVKTGFQPVDGYDVLTRLAQLPIQTWSHVDEDPAVRHMGPIAQDFCAAFGLGNDDKSIATVDADGVALASIQGVYEIVRQQEALIAQQQAQIADLTARLERIEAAIAVAGSTGPSNSGGAR